MRKIWHHYTLWEEHKYGMWSKVHVALEGPYFDLAVSFTSDHERYGAFMRKVIRAWKYSCEQNLTDASLNRRAWLGHAACALAFRCPEYLVRRAWWELTDEQRALANRQADLAIAEWEALNA